MDIQNNDELLDVATDAGIALQAIQDSLGRSKNVDGRVRFPRGFIRTAAEIRTGLPELGPRRLQQNMSYALMMTDVLRWIAVRTDLSGAALSMVVKEGICIFGALCESMTKEALRGRGSKKGFAIRVSKLVSLQIIDEDLKDELEWMWEIRCREHLYELDALEHDEYGRADYNRALKAYCGLRDALATEYPRS